MEAAKEIDILKALADGIDPATGEALPADNPCQQPQVIRALFSAIRLLDRNEGQTARPAPEPPLPRMPLGVPENAGKPWSQMEDDLLCERFDAGIPIEDIAQAHARTRGAILARLTRLGQVKSWSMAEPGMKANREPFAESRPDDFRPTRN